MMWINRSEHRSLLEQLGDERKKSARLTVELESIKTATEHTFHVRLIDGKTVDVVACRFDVPSTAHHPWGYTTNTDFRFFGKCGEAVATFNGSIVAHITNVEVAK